MSNAIKADPRQLFALASELRAAGREVATHGQRARQVAHLPAGDGEYTAHAAAARFATATWLQQLDLNQQAGSVERTGYLFELADGDLRGGLDWMLWHMRSALLAPQSIFDILREVGVLGGRRLLIAEAKRLLAAGRGIGSVTSRMRTLKGWARVLGGKAVGGFLGAVLAIPEGLTDARRQALMDRGRHDLSAAQHSAREWLSGAIPVVSGGAGGIAGAAATAGVVAGAAAIGIAGAPVVVGAVAVGVGIGVGYGVSKLVHFGGSKLRDFSFKKIPFFGGK